MPWEMLSLTFAEHEEAKARKKTCHGSAFSGRAHRILRNGQHSGFPSLQHTRQRPQGEASVSSVMQAQAQGKRRLGSRTARPGLAVGRGVYGQGRLCEYSKTRGSRICSPKGGLSQGSAPASFPAIS